MLRARVGEGGASEAGWGREEKRTVPEMGYGDSWLFHQQRELKANSWAVLQVGLYLTETTRDRISRSRAAPKTTRAAGGGGMEAAPYFRKQVMERIRNTVVDRNTSRRELKVALAKVFTGEFFITCLGGSVNRCCWMYPPGEV